MNDLTVLERAVLGAATAGSHPVLTRLRGQLDGLRVASRELTGHGFFTDPAVRDPASALPSRDGLAIHGVDVEMDGLAHGGGFVVFVARGLLALLEGFAFDEPWPAQPENWRITAARVKIMGRSAPPE